MWYRRATDGTIVFCLFYESSHPITIYFTARRQRYGQTKQLTCNRLLFSHLTDIHWTKRKIFYVRNGKHHLTVGNFFMIFNKTFSMISFSTIFSKSKYILYNHFFNLSIIKLKFWMPIKIWWFLFSGEPYFLPIEKLDQKTWGCLIVCNLKFSLSDPTNFFSKKIGSFLLRIPYWPHLKWFLRPRRPQSNTIKTLHMCLKTQRCPEAVCNEFGTVQCFWLNLILGVQCVSGNHFSGA